MAVPQRNKDSMASTVPGRNKRRLESSAHTEEQAAPQKAQRTTQRPAVRSSTSSATFTAQRATVYNNNARAVLREVQTFVKAMENNQTYQPSRPSL